MGGEGRPRDMQRKDFVWTMGRLGSFDPSITNYTCDSDAHSRYSFLNNKIEIEVQGLLTKFKTLKKSWPSHCEEGVAMNVTLELTTRMPTQRHFHFTGLHRVWSIISTTQTTSTYPVISFLQK